MAEKAPTRATGFTLEALQGALDSLRTRDLIGKDLAGRWDLLVPLMRRWLQLREGDFGSMSSTEETE